MTLRGIAVAALLLAALTVGFYVLGGPVVLGVGAGLLVTGIIVGWPLVGLGFTIITNVLSPLIGTFSVLGIALTIPRLLGAVTAASWFLWSLRRRVPLTFSPQMVPLACFVLVIGLSAMVVPDRAQSLRGLYLFLVVLLLYFLVANLGGEWRSLIAVCAVVSLMACLSSGVGLVQYVVPQFEVFSDRPEDLDLGEGAFVESGALSSGTIKRVTGGMGEPNSLAYMLAAVMPLNAFWWNAGGGAVRLLAVIATGLQLLALGLTFTRTGFLALGVAIAYLVWRRRVSPLALIGAAAAATVTGLFWLPQGFVERMFSITYLRGGSTPFRRDVLVAAWETFWDRWVFGYGFGQFGPELLRRSDSDWVQEIARAVEPGSQVIHNIGAHNLYLEVGIAYGLVGLVPFLAFLVWVLRDLGAAERYGAPLEQELAVAIRAGLIAFAIAGLFTHAMTMKIFWILAGMTVALRRVVFTRPAGSGVSVPEEAALDVDEIAVA